MHSCTFFIELTLRDNILVTKNLLINPKSLAFDINMSCKILGHQPLKCEESTEKEKKN